MLVNDQKISKINYIAMSWDGALLFFGLAFMDANAVIPLFVNKYTHSVKFTGLAISLNMFAAIISQIIIGPHLNKIKNIPRFISRMTLFYRPLPFLLIPVLLSSIQPTIKVAIFFVVYFLFFLFNGINNLPWSDLFGRTIIQENRSRVLGNQQLLGGIGGILAGLLISYLSNLDTINDDVRFSIIFGFSAFFFALSRIAIHYIKDLSQPRTSNSESVSYWQYFSDLPLYIKKDMAFRRVSLVRILSGISGMIVPLIIVFGKVNFALSDRQVSLLVSVQIFGGLAGGLLWRQVGAHIGNKWVIRISAMITLAQSLLAIISLVIAGETQIWRIMFILVIANAINSGSWVGFINYTIDIANEKNRIQYLMIGNFINTPLAILVLLGGFIADSVGFLPVFLIASLTAGSALCLSRRL